MHTLGTRMTKHDSRTRIKQIVITYIDFRESLIPLFFNKIISNLENEILI